MSDTVLQIYGPDFSNFVRSVALVCEEKQVPYQTGFNVHGEKVEYKSEQHLQLHPFGKLPILIHDDLILPETASICRCIDANFTGVKLQPESAQSEAAHDALCAIISIDIDKAIVRDYLLEFVFPKGENSTPRMDMIEQAKPKVIAALSVLSKEIKQRKLLGSTQLSIADALIAPMIHYLSSLPAPFNLLTEFPDIEVYLAHLMTHDSCQKVLVDKDLV